jgi:hypothetical protein
MKRPFGAFFVLSAVFFLFTHLHTLGAIFYVKSIELTVI